MRSPAAALSGAIRTAKKDFALFSRFPRLWLAVIGISLVPPLYALIYLSRV